MSPIERLPTTIDSLLSDADDLAKRATNAAGATVFSEASVFSEAAERIARAAAVLIRAQPPPCSVCQSRRHVEEALQRAAICKGQTADHDGHQGPPPGGGEA